MSARPYMVLVGGFLGAGKTSLILAAANELKSRGLHAAMVLNDQSSGLVDTRYVQAQGFDAQEVTEGCFCCRFSDFVEAAERLRAFRPDVIFAEPVGSCTDVTATTIRPLESLYGQSFRVTPLTVLVDGARAASLQAPDADRNLAFLFRKQLEEADLVCYSKSDLKFAIPEGARRLSSLTGRGVAAWLDEILSGELTAGRKTMEIDYEEYARAEAALVWLNARIELSLETPVSPAMLMGPLFEELVQSAIAIIHLKAIDTADSGYIKAAACENGQAPMVEGDFTASPCHRHEVRINLRASGDPDSVRQIVDSAIDRMPGRVVDRTLACFRPAPAKPEHRMASTTCG